MRTSRRRPIRLLVAAVSAAGLSALTVNAWQASAAPGADESTFVPVVPARVLDTRDPTNLGLPGPFVSAVSQDLRVTGTVPTASGTKVVVPDGATGVSLNVTVVNSSARGFISVRPADAPGVPTTSNLNFEAGAVTPNSVTVQLPASGPDAGEIEITFDAYGQPGPTVDVLVDVVGYTTRSGLADLQSQIDDLGARLASLPGGSGLTALQTKLTELETLVKSLPSTTDLTVVHNEITELTTRVESLDLTTIEAKIDELDELLSSIPDDQDLSKVVFDGDAAGGSLTGTFPSPGIASGVIGATQLASGAVTAVKVADGAITAAKLADGSVTAAKLADGSITAGKLAPGTVGPTQITNNSIMSTHITDGSITSVDLADGSVTTPKLADGSVTAGKLAPGAVGSSQITNNSINNTHITDGSVTNLDLADGAVGLSEMNVVFLETTVSQNASAPIDKCSPFVTLPAPGAEVGSRAVILMSQPASGRLHIVSGREYVELNRVVGGVATEPDTARVSVCLDNLPSNVTGVGWQDMKIEALIINP